MGADPLTPTRQSVLEKLSIGLKKAEENDSVGERQQRRTEKK